MRVWDLGSGSGGGRKGRIGVVIEGRVKHERGKGLHQRDFARLCVDSGSFKNLFQETTGFREANKTDRQKHGKQKKVSDVPGVWAWQQRDP